MKIKLKKRTKIILAVIASLIVLFIAFGNIDYNRIKQGKPPIMALYIGENGNNKKWIGLGYFVTKCHDSEGNEISQNKNYGYQISILINSHVCVYSFDVEIQEDDYIIVDETDICDTALEEIARDYEYIYYLDCIKSETIFLKYDNGEKITLKQALSNQYTSIEKLIEKGLEVYQKRIIDKKEI